MLASRASEDAVGAVSTAVPMAKKAEMSVQTVANTIRICYKRQGTGNTEVTSGMHIE